MKKGFTLIELLAVIVILAIIAVIAVPIVLNIINDSKSSSTLRSADFYLEGAETSIATSILNNIQVPDGTYSIMQNGNICIGIINTDNTCNGKILEVEMDGEVPTEGTITITNGNITGLSITLNQKEIYKNSKGELVYAKFLDEVCNPSKEQKYATNPYDEGYKYECKVDPNEKPYTFYVLNTRNAAGEIITSESTDKKAVLINLIMAQNINSDGSPTTKAIKKVDKDANGGIYNLVAWASKENYDADIYYEKMETVTAMNFLQEATKNWANANIIINSLDSNDSNPKNMKVYNTYARMPYYNEVKDVSTDKMWLIDYLENIYDEKEKIEGRENGINGIAGYWTLSYGAVYSDYAYRVNYKAALGTYRVYTDSSFGVRPVINLKL